MPKKTLYVIGHHAEDEEESFHFLVPADEGAQADDQNIEAALQFESLEEAKAAALQQGASVFEVVDAKSWPAKLEEV
jgi:hypothetical protein